MTPIMNSSFYYEKLKADFDKAAQEKGDWLAHKKVLYEYWDKQAVMFVEITTLGAIEHANPDWFVCLSWTPSQAQSFSLGKLIHLDDLELFYKALKTMHSNPVEMTIRMQQSDGMFRPISWRMTKWLTGFAFGVGEPCDDDMSALRHWDWEGNGPGATGPEAT